MRHSCHAHAFFCKLLVDNLERHLIKIAGGGRGIRTPEDLAALTVLSLNGWNNKDKQG